MNTESKTYHVQSAGGLVRNKKGEYVIINQWSKAWCLPKGHVEEGEEYEATARREVLEETGLQNLELVRYLGEITRSGGEDKNKMKHIHLFLFTTDNDELIDMQPEAKAMWMNLQELINKLTYKEDKEFLENLINERII